MKKNIFLLTTLGLVTTTLALPSGVDRDGVLNPNGDIDNWLSDTSEVHKIAADILSGTSNSFSTSISIDSDEGEEDTYYLVNGGNLDHENSKLAAVWIKPVDMDQTIISLKGVFDMEIADIDVEHYYDDDDVEKYITNRLKIALDSGYNDISVKGNFVLFTVLDTETGNDDHEEFTVDISASYVVNEKVNLTGSIRQYEEEYTKLGIRDDMTLLLVGVDGYMPLSDVIDLSIRANFGISEGTKSVANGSETDFEEDIMRIAAFLSVNQDNMGFEANIGQASADNGTKETLFQELNAEAYYHVSESIIVNVFAEIIQELENNDIENTETSYGFSFDWESEQFNLSAMAHVQEYDDEEDDDDDDERFISSIVATYNL